MKKELKLLLEGNLNQKLEIFDNFYFIDHLFEKRNTFLMELSKIIENDKISDYKIIDKFISDINLILNDIDLYDEKLNKCIYDISNYFPQDVCTSEYIASLINKHRIWKNNIKNIPYILNNSNILYDKNSPKFQKVFRTKFISEDIYNDFPFLYFYKKYNINNIIATTIIPFKTQDKNSINSINAFDLIVLRAIFVFYSNKIYRITYKNLFKYIASSKSYIVTNKQIDTVKNSIEKLRNLYVIIKDNISNTVYEEKLLYTINHNNSGFLILHEPFVYSFSTEHNLYIKLDPELFNCPISMTQNNIIIREYIIYKLIHTNKNNLKIFFDDFYTDLNIETNQNKKNSRDIVIRILEYWKSQNLISNFDINISNNRYIFFSITKSQL